MAMPPDEKANVIIASMMLGTAAIAVIPPVVDIAVFAAAVGGSVVAIGSCYGYSLSKDEGTKLVLSFITYGGIAFVGGKFISGILKATGLGYAAGGVIDAALYSAMSYAIGATAKAYFKGERDPKKLKEILKKNLKLGKKPITSKMSPSDKQRHESLIQKLQEQGLLQEERDSIISDIDDLNNKYL